MISAGDTHIPRGTEPTDTVPLFNAWTLWWNIDRGESGLKDYWQAPFFNPTPGAFALSEPQPILILLLPLAPIASLATIYNFYLLLSLTLNGCLAYALFRVLQFSRVPAFGAGVLIQTAPFFHWQLGVLQLIPVWAVLWVLIALIRMNESRSLCWSASLGIGLAVAYWCCNHYALFLVVLLIPSVWILLRNRLREPRLWAQLGAAVLWFALFAGPLVWGQWKYLHQAGFHRETAKVAQLSASPENYVRLPFVSRLDPVRLTTLERDPDRFMLSAGCFSYLLAAAGLIVCLVLRKHRSWALFASLFMLEAFVLSLGPTPDKFGIPLYRMLAAAVPGYAKIRSVYRYGLFVQLGCAFLGVACLQFAVDRLSDKSTNGRRALVAAAVALLFGLSIGERWPDPPRLLRMPWFPAEPEWCRYVREHTPPDAVLACFPFPPGVGAEDYEQQTAWMLAGIWYRRRIVNGYSGYFPESFIELNAAAQNGPDAKCLELLRRRGVEYCVYKESWVQQSSLSEDEFKNPKNFETLFVDPKYRIFVLKLRRP